MNQCLLDMDGVLVGFHEGMRKALGIRLSLEEIYKGREGTYCLAETIGMSVEKMFELITEEFWTNLPWEDNGQEILEICEARFGRENITIWTKPSETPGCHAGKIAWMQKHLPAYYSTVDGHIFGSKKYLGANKDTLLVDDSDSNITCFKMRGGECCLVPRIWNKSYYDRDRAVEHVKRRLG